MLVSTILALEQLAESLTLHEELDDKMHVSLTLLGFAAVAHRQRDGVRAARLCGAAKALLRNNAMELPPAVAAMYQREIGLVIELVGREIFDQEFSFGQELTLSEANSFAREALTSS